MLGKKKQEHYAQFEKYSQIINVICSNNNIDSKIQNREEEEKTCIL